MNFKRKLPSLTALVALEAVVRHRSVTLAARELGVTQAAVSRQVAALELEFGTELFVRGHRAIEPTSACAALANTLADSFGEITRGVEALRASLGTEVVTIGATVAFTTFWLLPRLADFRRLYPNIQIRLVSQDSKLNLAGGEVDVAIRYGVPPFGDCNVLGSRGDEIMPVCSPAYAQRLSENGSWQAGCELIEFDTGEKGWYTWRDWFARTGSKAAMPRPSLRFSHYTEAIAAARAGQGVALGWGLLVETFIDDGSLVRIGATSLVADGQHNVVAPLKPSHALLTTLAGNWMTDALNASREPAISEQRRV